MSVLRGESREITLCNVEISRAAPIDQSQLLSEVDNDDSYEYDRPKEGGRQVWNASWD